MGVHFPYTTCLLTPPALDVIVSAASGLRTSRRAREPDSRAESNDESGVAVGLGLPIAKQVQLPIGSLSGSTCS